MDDEILQHHFDEVFSALQDRENFEIFTKIKQTREPRVKQTFFKIVTPSQVNSSASVDGARFHARTPQRYTSQNAFKLTPFNSRPSSASTTTVKAKATFRPSITMPRPNSPRLSSRPNSPRPFSRGSTTMSSRTLSPRPITPRSAPSNSKYYTPKENSSDVLGECSYCGRFFLGDYLLVHEEKCSQEDLFY
ncbi:hypothetical protein D910_01232 [Dendroctonus ponderosae]